MINDCLFTALQFCNTPDIVKCLVITGKTNIYINKPYFWKLLCERDFMDEYNNIELDSYYKKYKQCYIFKLLKTEFKYGRMYQLVIDKSKSIPQCHNRRYEIIRYIESKTKNEIIEEANQIVQKHVNRKSNKTKKYNEFANLKINEPIKCQDDFYLGRCVQFILDSNNKMYWSEIFDEIDIVKKAHEIKSKMIYYIKEGDSFKIKGCDNCDTWYYGDRRCSCDNIKFYLECDDVDSLDDTDIYAYAASW